MLGDEDASIACTVSIVFNTVNLLNKCVKIHSANIWRTNMVHYIASLSSEPLISFSLNNVGGEEMRAMKMIFLLLLSSIIFSSTRTRVKSAYKCRKWFFVHAAAAVVRV